MQFEDDKNVDVDPYVAFRRRELRSTRKTRRTDPASVSRLRDIRDSLKKAKDLFELINQRERMRKEHLRLEHVIFESRVAIREMRRQLGLPEISQTVHHHQNHVLGSSKSHKVTFDRLYYQ